MGDEEGCRTKSAILFCIRLLGGPDRAKPESEREGHAPRPLRQNRHSKGARKVYGVAMDASSQTRLVHESTFNRQYTCLSSDHNPMNSFYQPIRLPAMHT
jgi:hypothetical protein